MKKTPLRIYDSSVTIKWDFEKAAEYTGQIHGIITFMDKTGKPYTIEYIDEDLNVVSTLKIEGDEKKFLEYETKMDKLLKGEQLNEE